MKKTILLLLAATTMTACSTYNEQVTNNNPNHVFIQDVRGENN